MISEPNELAVIGQAETAAVILREAAALAPNAEIVQAEINLANLVVDTEEQSQAATALAGRFSGWSTKIETYWKGLGRPDYDRYKLFNRMASEGIKIEGMEIPGTDRLNQAKCAAESKVRAFLHEKKQRDAKRQEALNRAVASDVQTIDRRIEAAADSGNMAAVRELRREREMTAQAPVIVAPPVNIGGAAQSEVVKWSIAPDTGLMDLVKAVAAGAVPLYHEVSLKGGHKEMRPLFLVNEVVLNQKARSMGKNLHYPGVVLEDDINLRTRKI